MVKALVYFASTLMLLLAVSIVANAFVFGRFIIKNCDESGSDGFTDMKTNTSIVVSVSINEELTSKLISSASFTTTTTTSTTSTTTTSTTSSGTSIPTTVVDTFLYTMPSIPTIPASDSSYDSYDYSTEESIWDTNDDSDWGFDWGSSLG